MIRFQEANRGVVKRFVGFLLDVADYGKMKDEGMMNRNWTRIITEY